MSCNPKLSVVIPAYLEEENLRVLLPRLRKVLEELQATHEILIVDTVRPMDNTNLVCRENEVRHIARCGGNAYGDAIRTGIANATGEYVLFMDADGSHSPEFIPSLWAQRDSGDVVVASRYVEGGATENPLLLIWMSRILNIIYTVVLNIRCKDVSNSFKLYKGRLLRQISLKCNNFDIVEEMLLRYSMLFPNVRIAEVPVVFKKRMFGQTKRELLLFILSFCATLLRLLRIRLFDAPTARGETTLP